MGLEWKIDVLPALKEAGYSTYRLRKENIFGQRTMQQLRAGGHVDWEAIGRICDMLNCQPGDILKYVKGDK